MHAAIRRTLSRFSMRTLAAMALVLSTAALCDRNPVSEWNDVRVELRSDGVLVTNKTDDRLAVWATDEAFDVSFPFTRCSDTSDACLRIQVGGSLLIPYADVPGYVHGQPIAVYTWTIQDGVIVEVADFRMATTD